MFSEQDTERFWSKVKIRKSDECWDWQAGGHGNGYGGFWYDGKRWGAHRIAWMFSNNQKILDDMVVMHSCDNPLCCNPAHLHLGTHADNVRDRVEKDRSGSARGEQHGMAKLTEANVYEIKRMIASGESRDTIAEKFDISRQTVSDIATGRSWTYIMEICNG